MSGREDVLAKVYRAGDMGDIGTTLQLVPALVEEVRRLREAVRMARDEMAGLVPKPRAVDLDDWPCDNEADRECLQSAWGELNRVLPDTSEEDPDANT